MGVTNRPSGAVTRTAIGAPSAMPAGTRRFSVISLAFRFSYLDTLTITTMAGVVKSWLVTGGFEVKQVIDWMVSELPSGCAARLLDWTFYNNQSAGQNTSDPILDVCMVIETPVTFNSNVAPLFLMEDEHGHWARETWYDLGLLSVFTRTDRATTYGFLGVDSNTRGYANGVVLPSYNYPYSTGGAVPSLATYAALPNIVEEVYLDPVGRYFDVITPSKTATSIASLEAADTLRVGYSVLPLSIEDEVGGVNYVLMDVFIPLGIGPTVRFGWSGETVYDLQHDLTDMATVIDSLVQMVSDQYTPVHGVYSSISYGQTSHGVLVQLLVAAPETLSRRVVTVVDNVETVGGFSSVRRLEARRVYPNGHYSPHYWLSPPAGGPDGSQLMLRTSNEVQGLSRLEPPICSSVLPEGVGGFTVFSFLPARFDATKIPETDPTGSSPGSQNNDSNGGSVGLLSGILKFFKSLFKAIFNFIKRNWLLIAIFVIAVAIFFPAVLPAIWGALSTGWATISGAIASAGSAYAALFSGLSFWEGAALLAGTAFIIAPEETSSLITKAGSTIGTAVGAAVGGAVGAAAGASGLSSALLVGAGLFAIYIFAGKGKNTEEGGRIDEGTVAPAVSEVRP